MTDLFSSDHLEAFYRSHVASRKTRLHEDIKAIENEIEKVKAYKSKFNLCCWWNNSLSSPLPSPEHEQRNTRTPDAEQEHHGASLRSESSQFKLYNSSQPSSCNSSPGLTASKTFSFSQPPSPLAYTWIIHDHDYCSHEAR